jgi:hypothetical protein
METITEEAELEEKVPQVSPLPEIEKRKIYRGHR